MRSPSLSGRRSGESLTAWPTRLRTSTRPSRSTISPRGACTLISRSWLFFASATYLSPDSTCRYQSRKKMTAKAASAMPPTIATRTASCGVSVGRRSLSRYIAALDLHAPQAERAGLARRLPAAPDLERVARQGRPQELADPGEDGEGEQRVQQDGHHHVAQHERADARPDVEHQGDGGERREPRCGGRRADRDGQQAVARVAHLLVAPDAVADGRQDEGGRAHRRARQKVEQEAGREARRRAGHAAPVVGHPGDREYDEVGVPAEDADLAERGQLQDHRQQQQQADPDERARREDHPPAPGRTAVSWATPRRVRTCTTSSWRRSANGLTCTRW